DATAGPGDTLALVDLEALRAGAADAIRRVAGVSSVQVADGAPRIAYRLGARGGSSVLVVRDLAAGREHRVRAAGEYRLAPDGGLVWFVREDDRGEGVGVYRLDVATG